MAEKSAHPRVELGKSGLKINPIGYGAMGLTPVYGSKTSEEDAIAVIHKALQLGVNFFDTAYLYGWGHNEQVLGKAIKSAIAKGLVKREDVVIATKYGFLKNDTPAGRSVSSSPEAVKEVVELSLKALDLDYIDLLYQHRVDPNTPIEDTIRAAAQYIKDGKVKALGLSEASVETIRRAHAVHPIAALETEYSLWTTEPETNGTLDTCRELGITFVAYSPLGRGFLTGAYKKFEDLDPQDWRRTNPRFQGENFAKNLQLVDQIKSIATKKGVTPGQLALAWVLRKPGVVAIPGTSKIPNLEENVAAGNVKLTAEEEKEITKILDSFTIVGARYPEGMMTLVQS